MELITRVLIVGLVFATEVYGNAETRTFIYDNTCEYYKEYNITINSTTEYVLQYNETSPDELGYPARVTVSSVDANETYPVFITAGQQKGIAAWALPMLVNTKTATEQFSSVSRTLCPHAALQDNRTVDRPLIHVTTSNPGNITATVKVKKVTDFYIPISNYTELTISPSQPKYYYFSFDRDQNSTNSSLYTANKADIEVLNGRTNGQNVNESSREDLGSPGKTNTTGEVRFAYPKFNYTIPKSIILIIESDDDICALVSIQNYSCPVFDNEEDVTYSGYYLTMTRKGGITLTQTMFPNGFYVVFIVKSTDEECTGRAADNETVAVGGASSWDGRDWLETTAAARDRVKSIRFRIIPTISYMEYFIGALAAFAFFCAFYVVFAASVLLCARRADRYLAEPVIVSAQERLYEAEETVPVQSSRLGLAEVGPEDEPSDSDSDMGSMTSPIQDGRAPPRLTLSALAQKKHAILENRSKKYLWNLLTVSIFYALPVIQLVITYQRMLFQTGNQDLCYYNFLCAHPLGLLSDANHVFSNVGYVLLGLLFLLQVHFRQARDSRRPDLQTHGVPRHYGLFYSMGVALMMEGLLSASYHVCPNTMNFQFDTSFMYVIAVLCMTKIYQFRHPDINARAHATFGVLACIIAIGLFGILNASLHFWVAFTVLHLAACWLLTIQIYYMGRFRFDGGGVLRRAWARAVAAPRAAVRPHHRARFLLLVLANIANWLLAAYGVYEHKKDFAKHLLAILMGNAILYTLFYIAMKVVNREPIRWYVWALVGGAHAAWFGALYLFLDQHTKWSLPPAQSRRLNAQCALLGLYDAHDLWHFASAVAMFLSFNILLALDDGLSAKPRTDIAVF